MYKYDEIIRYIEENYINRREIEECVHEKKAKDDPLPSIRNLANTLNCSNNSALRAYAELEKAHRIFSIPKSGYYVVRATPIALEKHPFIDLKSSNPDPRTLPFREFTHCVNRAVERYAEDLFLYPDPQGFEPLRKALISLFAKRQVYVPPSQICITNGVQQAISILLSMKYDDNNGKQKDTLLIEQPGYPLITKLAKLYGWHIDYIERNSDGISLKELEKIFSTGQIRYFYLMPRYQNPTGLSLSETQKKKIATLCEKYQVYIIEDDYLAELDSQKGHLPIHYYGVADQVIYLAGFSKSFIPGVRIGVACLPPQIVEAFCHCKYLMDLGTSMLDQGALELFLSNGMYERHQKKIIKTYQEKMNLCKRYVTTYFTFPNVSVLVPESGYYLWIIFDSTVGAHFTSHLTKCLKEKGVLVSNGTHYFAEKEAYPAIRLCISNCTDELLKKGLAIVSKEIQLLLPKSSRT